MPARLIRSVEAEYRRYKSLAEAAFAQLDDDQLSETLVDEGNSVAVVAWHLAENLRSRFTDFLDSDGEKPWRQRDEEFASRKPARAELLAHWEVGWSALFDTLAELDDSQLDREVRIRDVTLTVREALHRSLAHAAYHVGQIVLIARTLRGSNWRWLSIPPGESESYRRNPTLERAEDHAERLDERDR